MDIKGYRRFRNHRGQRRRLCAALVAVLLPVLAAGAGAGSQDYSGPGSPENVQAIEAQYLEAIRPHTVVENAAGGIAAGAVILYGQSIDPPYSIKIREDVLYLNGVVVDPPITPPWERRVAEIVVTERDRLISDLAKRIRTVHREFKAQGGEAYAQAKVVEHISQNEKEVRSAEWVGAQNLHLVMVAGEEFSMEFREMPASDLAEVRAEILQRTKERYEASLRSGGLLVIGYGPVVTCPSQYVAKTREQIDRALEERSVERLRDALFHDELVRELMFIEDRSWKWED